MNKIVQYWDGDIPDDVAALMKTWSVKNPEYDYQLFNHKESLSYIKENFNKDVFDAFNKLTIPAMVCDVFRVAFILKEGGVYVDCGIECLDSLSVLELKSNQCTLLRKWNGWVCNGFICATKDDPVVQKLWDKICNVLLKNTEGNIWALTGPKVYMEVTNQFLDNKLEFVKTENTVEVNNSNIRLLNQRKVLGVFNIVNRLEHKSRSHWSDMQKILTLFKVNHDLVVPDVFFNKKLIIHIGQHKTGSTAIQQSLFKSCDSNDSVLYPKTGSALSGHHAISDIFQKNNKQIEEFFVDFFAEVSESSASLVVLSSEYFSSGNEVFFNKIRMNKIWNGLSLIADKFLDSEIIYYVRPQVGSIESRVNQAIKSRLCLKEIRYKQFFDNPTLDYNLFDEAISKYFDKSKIVPRVFSRKALIDNDVISDFNTLVNCLELPKINTNKRIDNEHAVLKCLEINNLNITVDEKMERKRLVLNNDTNSIKNKGSFQLLDSKSRASIEAEYKNSNKIFFEKHTNLDAF